MLRAVDAYVRNVQVDALYNIREFLLDRNLMCSEDQVAPSTFAELLK